MPYSLGDTTSRGDSQLTDVNGTSFYSATDANDAAGYELWAYTP